MIRTVELYRSVPIMLIIAIHYLFCSSTNQNGTENVPFHVSRPVGPDTYAWGALGARTGQVRGFEGRAPDLLPPFIRNCPEGGGAGMGKAWVFEARPPDLLPTPFSILGNREIK